jgi:hypothetical protein
MKSLSMGVAAGGIAAAVVVGVASPASAASVACKVGMRNPVCAASFAQNPPGTLRSGVRTTGSATVRGKRVNWVCIGGNPRDCRY